MRHSCAKAKQPTRVLVLTEGRAKAVTYTEDGKEVVLGFMGPGELLGEVAAIEASRARPPWSRSSR